ncbi:MAG: NADH-quinone oxidoreductase subunit M [Acidobacteriaceae bacterium]|nr:NADH-quinone oxidoreductase subunit M [Acidobacteriaceae bacterium]
MNAFPLLSLLTVVPLIGALAILLVGSKKHSRYVALGFGIVALALTLLLWHRFNPAGGGLQFQEIHDWIPAIGVQYHLGIDGLGLVLLALAAIVVLISIAASWHVDEKQPLYFALILALQSGLFGTFTALNFFHWFLFWELSLIPAFFLVRLWGGPKRASASMQFFVYTMVGSVALLLAFLAIYLATNTFDFVGLAQIARSGQLAPALTILATHKLVAEQIALLLFFGAFLGFAVKVPLIPLHTWLPSTYSEAPTAVTILLTGAMSKMGVYGFLRILLPIFLAQARAEQKLLLWLAVITIVLAAFAALRQTDLKRIFAYSSINHLGYCMLAIFAVTRIVPDGAAFETAKASALSGAILQMFNHGLTASTLFWFVALIEKRTGGLRGLNDFGGLRKVAPVFTGLMGIALFSSLGLPGLNGFIGEFLIFRGVFPLVPWAAAVSLLGLLITAVFLLTILQRVFSGPLRQRRTGGFPDLTMGERIALAVPIALMFLLGLYPQLVLGAINSTVLAMVQQVRY